MFKKFLFIAAAGLLSGCATRPADVAPTYVSDSGYEKMSCKRLREEAQYVSERALAAANMQEKDASRDAAMTTVGVVLFWPALFFNKGDGANTYELARLKGEIEAIDHVNKQKGCGITLQRV